MKKKVFAIMLAVLIALPCVLMLNGGPRAPYGEESLGWPNLVGLVWFAFLVLGGWNKITPKWMRDELKSYMGEE